MKRCAIATSTLLVAGLVFVEAGCFLFPQPGNGGPAPDPLDGSWTVTETQMSTQWCLVIDQNEIADHDDGCDGSSELLIASAPGTTVGTVSKWTATVRYPGQGNLEIDYAYDVKEQLDGSLAGDVMRTFRFPGSPSTNDTLPIVMTRN